MMFVKNLLKHSDAHLLFYQMLLDERIAKIETMVAETLNEEGAQTKVCSIYRICV